MQMLTFAGLGRRFSCRSTLQRLSHFCSVLQLTRVCSHAQKQDSVSIGCGAYGCIRRISTGRPSYIQFLLKGILTGTLVYKRLGRPRIFATFALPSLLHFNRTVRCQDEPNIVSSLLILRRSLSKSAIEVHLQLCLSTSRSPCVHSKRWNGLWTCWGARCSTGYMEGYFSTCQIAQTAQDAP